MRTILGQREVAECLQSATDLEKLRREVFSQQIQCMLPDRSERNMKGKVVICTLETSWAGGYTCSDRAAGTQIKSRKGLRSHPDHVLVLGEF